MSDSEIKIALPETDGEKALCEILGGVLGTDSVGVTTDLFDLGLTSLGALHLVSEAEKKGIKIELVDLVKYRTVRGSLEALSGRQSEASKEDYVLSEERERKMPHPVPPGWLNYDMSSYHFPQLFSFNPEMDAQKICEAFNKAVANQSALSMIIEKDEAGQGFMRYDSAFTPHYEVERLTEAEFETRRAGLLQPFEMYGTPLIHAGVFETPERVYLFVDIHHIIMDGSAMALLYGDVEKAYRGEAMHQDTFCTWLAADHSKHESERTTDRYKESRERLQRLFEDDKTHIGFRPDHDGGASEIAMLQIQRVITKAELHSLVERFKVDESLICIGMACMAVARVDGDGDCLSSTIYHNRVDDVGRNAFGNLFLRVPVAVKVRKDSSIAAFFKNLKASWTDTIENGYVLSNSLALWPHATLILTTLLQALETAGFGYLSSLGARPEKADRVSKNVTRQSIQFIERPDGIVAPMAVFDKAYYSSDKLSAIREALETVIDRLVAVKDPETVTLEELLG